MQNTIVDITYKPKRYQNQGGTPYNSTGVETVSQKNDIMNVENSQDMPIGFVTIETAIKFYEEHSTNNTLFTLTANWLHELRAIRKQASQARHKEIMTEVMQNAKENDSTPEEEETTE